MMRQYLVVEHRESLFAARQSCCVAQTYEEYEMSKVAIENTKPAIAKPASKDAAHDVVATIAKGEATENAAKKKRQGVLLQRATCTVELAGLNTGRHTMA